MKIIVAGCAILLAGIMGACNGNNKVSVKEEVSKTQLDTAHYTDIAWKDSVVNVGNLTMGDTTLITFHFNNVGQHPLVIAKVRPGCGCTTAGYTKEPVLPGGEGVVTAAFDTKRAHVGTFRKYMIVTANTHERQQFELIFTGEIKEK
ncbi:Protein of unknown function [Filimonas lacunae]|uniref:DUF1573 domain-containing protein n=1 Tax=Filimonas lacunae TaxID=477680 RepID=A0A173MJT1_9BACT|nr:DUF1573 domain-containing protein [Filimonas lacunae]BAV07658.1 hypothetical protein FLA_3689 [Filimonas lacunae]SIT03120.1 Protein of unknown function [Filimonas lacunae]